jgi:hypothetical protein
MITPVLEARRGGCSDWRVPRLDWLPVFSERAHPGIVRAEPFCRARAVGRLVLTAREQEGERVRKQFPSDLA